jgi:c(7)-type cytochrome triheme protein
MNKIVFSSIIIAVVIVSIAMKEPSNNGWKEIDHSKFIKFSHTFHVKETGVACADCHQAAKASKQSSDNLLGDHESCKSCHEDQLSNTCDFCHVDPENITAISNPEREVIFSHENHASKRNIGCETCHAGLNTVTYATSENMPSMSGCINCHTKEKASTECTTCHSDFAQLIPSDHLAGDYRKDHKHLTRLGEQNVSCSTCHSESFCQDCHTGIELKGFGTDKDLMADPYPRTPLRDTPREQKLQNVHNLNYRYTHGIDARSKAVDCYSCHDQSTFCTECHQAGGSITQDRIRPKNHDEPGFKTIGKGSGGGRHAELAERDIEYCMSCHDVEGKDPVCMMCHSENGGIR